jgi:hypothetical protein
MQFAGGKDAAKRSAVDHCKRWVVIETCCVKSVRPSLNNHRFVCSAGINAGFGWSLAALRSVR